MDADMIPDCWILPPKPNGWFNLSQNGAPSQIETFDYKTKLKEMFGRTLLILSGRSAIDVMTSISPHFPWLVFAWFKQLWSIWSMESDLFTLHRKNCRWSMPSYDYARGYLTWTRRFTFSRNGCTAVANRPSMGSWLSYGLGSENQNLPAFTVLLSRGI